MLGYVFIYISGIEVPGSCIYRYYYGQAFILLSILKGSQRLCFTKLIDVRVFCPGYVWAKLQRLIITGGAEMGAFCSEHSKASGREKREEGGGQVHGSSCKKLEGIINTASFSPASLSLQIGLDLSSSWVRNDKAAWRWIRAKVVVLHSAAVIYMYRFYVVLKSRVRCEVTS